MATKTGTSAAALVVLLIQATVVAQDIRSPRWWLDRASAEIDRFPDVADKVDPSLEALNIPRKTRRADLLAVLARTQAKTGERGGALRSVAACEQGMRKTPAPQSDAYAHAHIAGVHARLGDMPAARRSVDAAFAALEQSAKADPSKAEERRDSLAGYVIQQFTDAGAYDEAIARTRRLAGASARAMRFGRIAEAQHEAGLDDAARKTMAEAERAARAAMKTAPEADRYDELAFFCSGLVEIGDLDGAERVAAELPVKDRASLYTTLAARHHDAKNAAASKRLAAASLDALRKLPADDLRVKMEGPRLAGFFTFVGDRASAEQALALVKTDGSDIANVQVHYGVALLHARSGNVAAARAQVDLARKAEAAVRGSALGEAVSLVSALQPWPAKVAQAHIGAGHSEEALRLMDLYKDDEAYAASLRTVLVLGKAAAGDVAGVKRELDKLEPGLFSREIARAAAIKALARNPDEKRLRDMAAWLGSLPDAEQRIGSYLAVCDALLSNPSRPER